MFVALCLKSYNITFKQSEFGDLACKCEDFEGFDFDNRNGLYVFACKLTSETDHLTQVKLFAERISENVQCDDDLSSYECVSFYPCISDIDEAINILLED